MTLVTFKTGDYPHIASMWHPTKNSKRAGDVTSGSSEKAWFLCDKSHEFEAAPRDMTRRTGSCPVCSGKKVLAGYNDLASQRPEVAADWAEDNPYGPDEVTVGSNKMVRWVGISCGHSWETRVKTRTSGRGCPICSGNVVLKGFNDAATQFPHLKETYARSNANPLDSYVGSSNAKVAWTCNHCDHQWEATINNRTNRGTGCPSCGAGRINR